MSMKRYKTSAVACLQVLALASALLLAAMAQAQAAPDMNEVLVENRWAKVTRGDYEAELLRLPADIRGGFAVNAQRVSDLLLRMLVTKSLALQARASDVYKDVEVQRRRALEIDRVDAGILIAKLEDDAGKAFDARKAQFEARVREIYLATRDTRYRVPEQVAASHILIDTKSRSKEEALKLAQDARVKLAAGEDFSVLAKRISDDPSAQQNGGHIDYFDRKKMDPAFSEAAFTLKNVGDLSEPVLSSFGYHVIRLDGRRGGGVRSFDEVRDTLLAEERGQFVAAQRDEAFGVIRDDPFTKFNQSAVDALVIKVDPEAAKKALEAAKPK
jgi:peptidyl-prolyl cis-trans isomerase C